MQISVALLHIMPDNTGIYIKNMTARRTSLAMVCLLVDCTTNCHANQCSVAAYNARIHRHI